MFKEKDEHLGPDQESGEWPQQGRDGEEEKLSGESEEWDDGSEESDDEQDCLCKNLAEEKTRYRDRELQTDPSSGTYIPELDDAYGGEELETIAVSRKPFRELSFNSNIRTNLIPEDDREIHRPTYHLQTNGLVERQNRTLANMLRVYCSRYMTDWDKYLAQVVGVYNSTQHSTTGISPFMMLTGREGRS